MAQPATNPDFWANINPIFGSGPKGPELTHFRVHTIFSQIKNC